MMNPRLTFPDSGTMSAFPPPLKVDLKAKSDQFWRDLETYLKQVSPEEAEDMKKKFMDCHRGMIQKFSLEDLEEMTKNVLKHLNEEQSGEMYSQSAASSHSPAPPFVDSQQPRESN